MDNIFLGSVNSYIKNFDMQTKWQNKKNTGEYKNKTSDWLDDKKNTVEYKNKISDWLDVQKNTAETDKEDKKNDSQLTNINNKLLRGERLTFSEKQYLQQKDPSAYQKVVNTELEQAYYEHMLKCCRTKNDVQRLKMARAVSSLGTVNSVRNNTSMSQDKKAEIISEEQMKAAAAERTEREFMKSGGYSSLPTESERIIAAKKLAKAEAAERQAKREERAQKRAVVKKPKTEIKNKEKGEKTTVTKTVETGKKRYKIKRGPTKAQAEQSPEVKKVKRARRRRRRIISGTAAFSAAVVVKSLDVKA